MSAVPAESRLPTSALRLDSSTRPGAPAIHHPPSQRDDDHAYAPDLKDSEQGGEPVWRRCRC